MVRYNYFNLYEITPDVSGAVHLFAVFEMRGVWGVEDPHNGHKARGTSHQKEKCKLWGSHILMLYRCNYAFAVVQIAMIASKSLKKIGSNSHYIA